MDFTFQQSFEKGDRVELHPGLDLWVRGAKFGTVKKTDVHGMVHVKVDHVRTVQKISKLNLRHVPVPCEVCSDATASTETPTGLRVCASCLKIWKAAKRAGDMD